MGSSNWYPGAFAIVLILLVGLLFPLITSGFVDEQSVGTTGLMNTTISYINDGYNFTIHIPVLPDIDGTLPSIVPSAMREPLTSRLAYMSLIPDVILVPILILILLGMAWTIVKLVVP